MLTAVGFCVELQNILPRGWGCQDHIVRNGVLIGYLNTFAASYLNTQGLNNSCLKSPASTLVDLTFQSRALRSFSLNQLVTCRYRRETYTAASVYLADIIFIPFIVQYAYIAI